LIVNIAPDPRLSTPSSQLEELVLSVHRRNGGTLLALDWSWRLLEAELGLDSLDLAEIVAAIEKHHHVFLFDAEIPPRTWGDVRNAVMAKRVQAHL
jgi:hypothetical protein